MKISVAMKPSNNPAENERNLPSQCLKCVSLNVSGLQSKLTLGILDRYLANFDMISLVETYTDMPNLSDALFNKITCYPKKCNPAGKYKYGGIQGLCFLVNPAYDGIFEIITDDVESDCILWGKIQPNDSFQCMTSLYSLWQFTLPFWWYFFSQFEGDILSLKCRYNLLKDLFGYFNAHTKLKDDLIQFQDMTTEITGCDSLCESNSGVCNEMNPRFTNVRYTQHLAGVNKNGNELLSSCQSLDFRIVNGRFGSDKNRGRSTCHKSGPGVIDYVIVCEKCSHMLLILKLKCLTHVFLMSTVPCDLSITPEIYENTCHQNVSSGSDISHGDQPKGSQAAQALRKVL